MNQHRNPSSHMNISLKMNRSLVNNRRATMKVEAYAIPTIKLLYTLVRVKQAKGPTKIAVRLMLLRRCTQTTTATGTAWIWEARRGY